MELKHTTKQQFANSLGMSISTLQRRLKEMDYKTTRNLLSPDEQTEICETLRKWELKHRGITFQNRVMRNDLK